MPTRYLIRLIEKDGKSQLRHAQLSSYQGERASTFAFPTTGLPQTATDADWTIAASYADGNHFTGGEGLHFWEVTSGNLDKLIANDSLRWRGYLDTWALWALTGYPRFFGPPQRVGQSGGSWCTTSSKTLILPRVIVASFDDSTVLSYGDPPTRADGTSHRAVESCSVVWCSISDATAESYVTDIETDHAAWVAAVDAGGDYETEYETLAGFNSIGMPTGSATLYWQAVRNAARTYLESVL